MDEKVEEKRRNPVSLAFKVISGIFSPIIPAIAGAGILKGVLSLFVTFFKTNIGTATIFPGFCNWIKTGR